MFIITGLPRSRTAWFAAFMSAANAPCLHESTFIANSREQFITLMTHYGTADSGIIHNQLALTMDLPTVIIERDIEEVQFSLDKLFPRHRTGIDGYLLEAKKQLDKLKGLRVAFDNVNDSLAEIFNYCTGRQLNNQVATMFKDLKIEQKSYSKYGRYPEWLIS